MTIRTNTNNVDAEFWSIMFPDRTLYVTDAGETAWDKQAAMAIAKNVAKSRRVTVTLHKVEDTESPYDRIVAYVDTLKGGSLTTELIIHGLPQSKDAVASKRLRLISHFTKGCTCND